MALFINRVLNRVLTRAVLPLIASVAILASAAAAAQSVSSSAVNPLESDPRAARAGGALFRAQCATCHGADAKGIETIDAPDLTAIWEDRSVSDGQVFQAIRQGVPGSIMPPHGFPNTEIWMLVSYLRSVSAAGSDQPFTGDVANGQALFADNCARCHRVAGAGGSLGPELSRITGRRSVATLINSIRQPSATIGRRYRPVSLTTASNQRLRGTVKSEDAFSILLMDTNQQLRAYNKQQLTELVHETESLMPVFSPSALSDAEINDILSYFDSTR